MTFEINKLEVNRNPFIGLYFTASEDTLLCAPSIPQKDLEIAVNTLKPKKICLTFLASSTLVGLFSVANSNGVILPTFIEPSESSKIKKELAINVALIDDKYSAIRNNIVANDKGCLASDIISSQEVKKIRDCLDVEVVKSPVGGIKTVGSVNVATNEGVYGYNGMDEEYSKLLRDVLKVKVGRGTINLGTVANSLGIAANSKGAVVGSLSSGFEISSVYEALSQ